MASIVEGKSAAETWAAGVRSLETHGWEVDQLVSVIHRPTVELADWYQELDPRRINPELNSLRSVVRMVGPDSLTNTALSEQEAYGVAWNGYDRFRALQRGKRKSFSGWHDTYFERLTKFGPDRLNQVGLIIQKLRNWQSPTVGSLYAHTTSMELDALRRIGAPCLQYVQFLPKPNRRLDMVVLYRNHDFLTKALGNFIGLGRLLGFVVRQTNYDPGRLTCFSAHAFIENHKRALATMANGVPRNSQTSTN